MTLRVYDAAGKELAKHPAWGAQVIGRGPARAWKVAGSGYAHGYEWLEVRRAGRQWVLRLPAGGPPLRIRLVGRRGEWDVRGRRLQPDSWFWLLPKGHAGRGLGRPGEGLAQG